MFTRVAWIYASERFMLASASHDGTVHLWVTPKPRPVLDCVAETEAEPEDAVRDRKDS